MKTEIFIVILIILLNLSLIANVILLTRPEPQLTYDTYWTVREGDYYKYDACGNILDIMTKEEIDNALQAMG